MSLYKDIVICCSIQNKNEKKKIYESIEKLGGSYCKELKKSVTHLIAYSSDSEKYKMAFERGIPILTTEWINECIKNKNNINPYDEMKKHLFRPFNNFFFNIEKPLRENKEIFDYMIKIIKFLGGRYESDIKCECTHVVVSDPESSTSELLRSMKVNIVTPNWIFIYYLKYLNYTESDNYIKKLKINKNNYDFFRSKIFFLSESLNDEIRPMLLKIILKANGNCSKNFSNDVTTFIINDEKLDNDEKKLLLQSACGTCTIINYRWLLKCYIDKHYIPEDLFEVTNIFQSSSSIRGSLFKGLIFLIHFHDEFKKESLKEKILLHQGTIYNSNTSYDNSSELLIITPFSNTFKLYKAEFDQIPMKKRFITNYWVEKCIRKKKLYNFDKYPMFAPCKIKNGLIGLTSLKISTTGFNKLDKLYIRRMIVAMGSQYQPNLTKETQVLLFHDSNIVTEKISKAYEYNIPIVSIKWLYECYNQASFTCFNPYQIN